MLSDLARFIETCPRRRVLLRRSVRSCSKVSDVDPRRGVVDHPLSDTIENGRPVLPCTMPCSESL